VSIKRGDVLKNIIFFGLVVMYASNANATIINGGFESGNLDGWTVTGTGNAQVVSSLETSTSGVYGGGATSDTTVMPTEGGYFAAWKAGSPTTSLTSSPFWADAGETFSVDLAFSSGDWGGKYNDGMAWGVSLTGVDVTVFAELVSDTDAIGPHGYTGWDTYSASIQTSGWYEASLSVFNVSDNALPSIGFADNAIVGAVPIASTIALMVIGFAGMRHIGNNTLQPSSVTPLL
jgi:hypothetical protein